jgi:endonuclease G
MKRYSIIILLFTSTFICSSQVVPLDTTLNIFFPTSTSGEIINHKYYSLSYTATHKLAEWVIYKLTCDQTKGEIARSNSFRPDPLIIENGAQLIDYRGSGYDRGHLAPAGDMKMSFEAMSESFYLSNMTPQHPSLNRGIWLGLEDKVRSWACEDSILYVVAGPIFTKSDTTIGPNRITVPSFYFKIVFYNNPKNYELIGFIFPNRGGTMELKDYVYKVDDIESMTGIDFFPFLPDSTESRIEKNIKLGFWHFEN